VVDTTRRAAASRAKARSAGTGGDRAKATRRTSGSSRSSSARRPSRPRPPRAAWPRSSGRSSGRRGAPRGPGVLSDHGADLWAIALVTAGILLGLAVYGDAAGAVGHGVDVALAEVVGWARFLLPPACVVAGGLVIAGRRELLRWRAAGGALLTILAACGLAELAGGSPRASAPNHVLAGAGGLVGVGTGSPLHHGLGAAGAVVVLVAVAVVGTVLATGASLRSFGRALATMGAGMGRAFERPIEVRDLGDETPPDSPRQALGAPADTPTAPVLGLADEPDGLEDLLGTDEPPPSGTTGRGLAGGSPEAAEPAPAAAAPEGAMATSRKENGANGPMGPASGDWRLPPLRLLSRSKEQRLDERLLDQAGEALVASLAAHGVETRLVGRTVGPTVTRFELELGPGVKVARVTSLSRDIAYAMASPDVRILAPIPGKSAIGVEVPNRQRQLVSLGDILASDEAARARHPLEVALGRDIAGRPVMVNLSEMPHVLISGATGAGKSSCINSLITSVLMRATPDEVRLILVDPKRVELGQYNGLPHLLTPVVVDPKKAANALAWAVKEMERRYDLLAEYGVRDIAGYNEALAHGELGPVGGPSVASRVAEVAALARAAAAAGAAVAESDAGDRADGGPAEGGEPEGRSSRVPHGAGVAEDRDEPEGEELDGEGGAERLPFVLVVVDELNDLMMVAARDVEESVVRIAQMARAVGIHLVLATQRPSVDVITGVIKANIPSRMAFSVSSLADSRVILDQQGAERLIGKGDMLLLTASSSVARRLQTPWVSEAEVRNVVAHWRRQGRTVEPVVAIDAIDDRRAGAAGADEDEDDLLADAMELVVRSQLGSTSMLQRKLRVGFARAGRLMDLLERRGVVGPSEGSKARAVLMTPEELDGGPG
jgi:DNA segregation ATPase FtsK/SpoIIIE, S-DNA-T family